MLLGAEEVVEIACGDDVECVVLLEWLEVLVGVTVTYTSSVEVEEYCSDLELVVVYKTSSTMPGVSVHS